MEARGHVTRPMNSFMLYRSAYAARTKAWCHENNHQVVSSLSGESWPLEPEHIRAQFDEWAKIERQHHQQAHPDYKFSPSKANNKRRKDELSDDEGEPSDFDADPDGEYRGGSRRVRQMRHDPRANYVTSNVGFETHPYYDQQPGVLVQSQNQFARPLPSQIGYDQNGFPHDQQASQYYQTTYSPQMSYAYMHDMQHQRVQTPSSLQGQQQSLGNFGIPQGFDETFDVSRNATPFQHQQQQQQYAPDYNPYQHEYLPQAYQQVSQAATPQPAAQMHDEHRAWLQRNQQPQHAVDPGLGDGADVLQGGDRAIQAGDPGAETHFEQAAVWPENFVNLQNDLAFLPTSPTGPDPTLSGAYMPEQL